MKTYQSNNHIILYSNCFITLGSKRSLLIDTQRSRCRFVPNALFHISNSFRQQSIEEILSRIAFQDRQNVEEYFAMLIGEEYGLLVDKSDLGNFPILSPDPTWCDTPIENCIIECDPINLSILKITLVQLNQVKCHSLEIRFQSTFNLNEVKAILTSLSESKVKDIKLIFPYCDELDQIIALFLNDNRITSISVSNSPENLIGVVHKDSYVLYFSNRPLHLKSCCGNFNPGEFFINDTFYFESLDANTCLHKKVSVCFNGLIKNCPSMIESYGNILTDSIKNVVNSDSFKYKPSISKKNTIVCSSCEFRNICLDCRAYLSDPNNPHSKPLKCGYDPENMLWSNPLENSELFQSFNFYKIDKHNI